VEKKNRGREKEHHLVEKKRGDAREQIRQREKKNRDERELELPKDLSAKSENCRDLFVKQIFPSI
jgi:hypothetical protein